MKTMKIRAVQLDLARQKETPEYVMSYADFAKASGFNTLLLYLEGKVRTPSFPYPARNESYELEDMQRIVEHCRKQKLDVIPCVSTLEHAELFLKYPQMVHLAEFRDNQEGRWFKRGIRNMVCPSLDEAYEFFDAYLREIIPLFPSPYFHLGLDECFELGFCDICRNKRDEKHGYAPLLAEHVRRVHAIVTRLGKRMMMWDDLFEVYPQALAMIPRDIVLCCWCYDHDASMPIYHFLQRRRHDPFARYEKLGFEYLACPADRSAANIASLTRYAEKHKPLGMLLTQWEKGLRFYHRSLPLVAMAGRMWSGRTSPAASQDSHVRKAIRQTTRVRDPRQQGMIAASLAAGVAAAPRDYTRILGMPDAVEEQSRAQVELLCDQLGEYLAGDGGPVLQDIAANLLESRVNARVRIFAAQVAARCFGLDAGGWQLAAKEILADITRLRKARRAQWRASRPGIPAKRLDEYFRRMTGYVQGLAAHLRRQTHMLVIRWFLPDMYGAPFVGITMLGKRSERELLEHVQLKPLVSATPYYEYFFPFRGRGTYRAVRVEIAGYGGQGLAHVKLLTPKTEMRPMGIGRCEGVVSNPAAVLRDDLKWCYLGVHDAAVGFMYNDLGRVSNSIEILLEEK